MKILTIFLIGLLAGPTLAPAALIRDLTLADLDHSFILDSDEFDGDPATNRHTAETTFSTNFETTGINENHSGWYRVAYRLKTDTGTILDLVNGDAAHPTQPNKWAYSDSQLVFIIGPGTQNLSFEAIPDPVATLDSKTPHQVEGFLQRRTGTNPDVWQNVTYQLGPFTISERVATPLTQFLHFTNTVSGDAEFNARAGISNLAWTRTHAVTTDPTSDGFTATADVFVNRWDDFNAAELFGNIAVTVDFDLIEVGSGANVPLENDGINTFNSGHFNHNFATPPGPAFRSTNTVIATIKPLIQISSASETYVLRCKVSHVEDGVGSIYTDLSCDLPAEQLLHFNGNLSFGPIATTFAQLGNIPTILAGSNATFVNSNISIPADQGSIPNRPTYGFGNNTPLPIQLLNNGDAVLLGGSQLIYVPGSPGATLGCDHDGIAVQYSSVILSTSGAAASAARVNFPQGLTLLEDSLNNPYLGENHVNSPGSLALDSHLCPQNPIIFPLGANARVTDESHPLSFAVSSLTVEAAQLIFSSGDVDYVHDQAYQELQILKGNGLISDFYADRRSNDRYLKDVNPVSGTLKVTLGTDGTSRLTADLEVKDSLFQSHFPTRTTINNQGAALLSLENGIIKPDQPLSQVSAVTLAYFQTCPEDDCVAAIPPETLTQIPNDNKLFFVPGGGLQGPGEIANPSELIWGLREPGQYAHRTNKFTKSSFFMPGYQLYAEDNVLLPGGAPSLGDGDLAPSTLLLAGFNRNPSNPDLHFSSEAEYTSGDGDLPGLNFDVENANFTGASRLGGAPSDYGYDLLPNASKYYIRLAGVSGRQIATNGTFDSELILHGFPSKISQFQLSFLDSDNSVPGTTSWVDGTINTVGPYSKWDQIFTGLRFDCLGEPGEMTPDLTNANDKALTYWNSTFDLKTLKFAKEEVNPGACPKVFTAKLVAGAKTQVAYIEQDLFGALAFCPDGNLSTEETQIEGYNSQLGIPANIPLDGPNKNYTLTTTSRLRFSNPLSSGAPPVGFVTFAATVDIPYFVDLQIQAITSATPGAFANFYLTPGWSEGGETFFSNVEFDPTHRGFPAGGISFAEYREPDEATSETYLITAEQKLFNVIDLKYPLKWDIATRRFSSMQSQKQELFVTQVEHQIEWMDAKFANISFGAKYDGLPQLKLSNYLNDQIDNAADIIASEFNTFAKQAVDKAIEEMDKMLEDSLEAIIDPLVDAAEAPLTDLHSIILNAANATNDYMVFRNRVEETLTDPISILYQSGLIDPLLVELRKAGMATSDAHSFIKQLDDALQDIVKGIDAIAQGVQVTAGEVQFQATLPSDNDIQNVAGYVPGLLFKEGDQRNIIQNVVNALLNQYLGPELQAVIAPLLAEGTSALNQELNELLTNLEPTLDQIRVVLLQVREVIVEIRTQVAAVAGVAQKIEQIIQDAESGGLLAAIIDPVGQKAWARFLQLEAALGIDTLVANSNDIDDLVGSLTADEFIQLLKDELKAGILGSDIVQEMQFMLRQTLYDVQDRITSAVQSVLDQLSGVLKEVVAQTVGELEEQINPLLGQVSKYMGSGEITGYAEINGDSLRKLRLDAKMQFELPEEMSLHVYLEILSYSSEDNFVESGCIKPGEKAVEIRIGAQDVAIQWISDIRLNLEVKMTLKDKVDDAFDFPVPNGVGGKFEMTDGVLDFQAFKVIEFGATIAIGVDETYIGAKARAIFSSYEVAAAIFFGRTCTLDPLLFVDPDIGDVVTAGTTFTGAYVYGEVWLPISELVLGIPASCLFRIDAGVGAGAFYFLEGPTYGGKMFLGVSGEALCLVSIRGDVKMIVASQAGDIRGAGSGKFSAKVGWCPFCIKFSKSVKIKFDNGSWSID